MHSSVTNCVVAMYPSPAGATESELHFETWSRLVGMNPVLRGPRARRRGADRQPHGRPARVRDRADRPLLHARRARSRRRGRASRAAPAWSGRSRATSTSCGGWPREPARGRSRRRSRPSRSSRCSAPPAAGYAAVPGASTSTCTSREPGGRQVYAIALTAQVMIEPARRAVRRRDARAARRAVRAAGALGHDDAQPRLAPGRRARAGLHGVDHLPHRGAGDASTWRSRPRSTCTGCRTARCRSRSTSTGRCTTAATTGGCRCRWSRGRARPSSACPVATWRDLIEHYYPRHRLDRAARGDPAGAPAREGARARCRRSTRAWRSCSRRARERRRAGRLAALRGLRAVPVHAGSDQERDADAVRDRLPARLRRGRSTRPTTTSSCSASSRAGARSTAEVRFLAAERRAPRAEPQRIEGEGDFEFGGAVGPRRNGSSGQTPLERGRSASVSYRVENRTAAERASTRRRRSSARSSRPTRSCASREARASSPSWTLRATASTPGPCSPRRTTT